jgi:hypothetical protein
MPVDPVFPADFQRDSALKQSRAARIAILPAA